MAGFKLELFKGIRPRISDVKLPTGEATTAENVDLGSGDIEPWDDKSTEQAVSAGRQTRTIYQFDDNGDPKWLEWDDYVDVVRGPVKDDVIERTYYTGDTTGNGSPKMTNTDLVGNSGPYPENWVYMGVPAPASAPTVTTSPLPEDLPSGDRFVDQGGIKADSLVIDNVNWTVYPGTGTRNQTWRYDATPTVTPNIAFEMQPGTAFRVTEVINSNKIKLESASESGIFLRTTNSDKTTDFDWMEMDEQGTTQLADFVGVQIPLGVTVTIVGHRLSVGDVISTTAIRIPPSFLMSAVTDFYEQDWNVPTFIEDAALGNYYNVANAEVTPTVTKGDDTWYITGSFYYEVDRLASDVSSLEDRRYVYTYVTDLGEEGPPSPASEITPTLDGTTVTIDDLALPPTIGYNIVKMRIYRTSSSEAGTEFQFVKELNVATTTTEAVPSTSLAEIIGTTTWDPPDPDMEGLTSMPNGMLVGFKGKNIYFCEPYFPHAWPAEYDQAIDHEIIGLAAFGNSVAVMTKGWPYLLTGSHPRNVNVRPIKVNQACTSAQSIATDGDKVYYSSPDGLVEISVNGVRVATEDFLDKEDWETYDPTTFVGEFHEGRYYGFYDFDVSAIPPVITAEVSGTIATATEDDIINGGKTIILTLTNDVWVDEGTAFDAQRQLIINGLSATTDQTLGWNNLVRDAALLVGNVVRTDDVTVTITLPVVPGYSVTTDEVIQPTIPATALSESTLAVATGSTFSVVALAPAATLSMGGSLDTSPEADVVTGGETVTLTLTNDTWVTGTDFDAARQGIIDGVFATTDEVDGWNDTVPQEIALTDVVRTSDLIVTITLPAVAAYSIDANESLSATISSTALTTSLSDVTALNTISILDAGVATALFSGTVTSATENDIVAGSETLIITLTNETWVAAGTGPIGSTAVTQSIIDALIATTSQTLGWNNVVVPGIETADLVRTSNTVATITLDAESTYSIATSETIGCTIPAAALTLGANLDVTGTFGITAQAPVTCALTGTITASIEEDAIVAGGKTIILTLTSDTWKAAGTGPIGATADTQAIIDGLTAASSPTNGWNNEIRDGSLGTGNVVRTSDTVCTITVPADAQYAISSQEVITATVPAAALNISASPVVASPTFTIDDDVPATAAITGTLIGAVSDDIRAGGKTIIVTIANDTLVDDGATFNAQRQNIIDGLDAATSPAGGWNNEVRDNLAVTDVVRTSNTVVTITLSAQATYAPAADETVTVTFPATALVQSSINVTGSPTIATVEDTQSINMLYDMPGFNDEPDILVADGTATDWTSYQINAGTDSADRTGGAIIFGNGTWTVVGKSSTNPSNNAVWISTNDGVSWTQKIAQTSSNQDPRVGYYHALSGYHIVIDIQNYLVWSDDDGVTWNEENISEIKSKNSDMLVNAGDYVITSVATFYNAPYEFAYWRSSDLTTASDPGSTWTKYTLTFDGVVTAVSNIDSWATGSGNGKNIFVITVDDDTYISTVPHNSTTETYVGKLTDTLFVADSNKDSFFVTGDTKFLVYSNGRALSCTIGSEGTIGNWTDHGEVFSDDADNTVNIRNIYFDAGATGETGLGFVATGYKTSNKKIVYTSADGITWIERATNLGEQNFSYRGESCGDSPADDT